MSKERVISQIGDSTDGEHYEDDNISTLLKKYGDYHVSYILKDLGNKLLQNSAVRTKYTEIKKTFSAELTRDEKIKLKSLDIELGYCWGIIVNKYDIAKQKVLATGASSYFELNKNKIERDCGQEADYQNLDNDADKANYYLSHKVNIQSKLKDVYKLNKKIEKYAQSQRVVIEPSFSTLHSEDASMFLAKIKASKKLDKDLGKNLLYDYKFGTHNTIGNNAIAKKTTQQNEIFEVKTAGGFLHYVTDEGTYNDIGTELKSFISQNFINILELKKFLQSALKGVTHTEIINNHDTCAVLIDRLQTLVKLVFGVEVKRNASALLTHAMFFDLVDADAVQYKKQIAEQKQITVKYHVGQIAEKIPMAMNSAVSASVTIDRKVKERDGLLPEQKLISEYDYRTTIAAPKARELLKKDQQILQDWLRLKLDIHNKLDPNNTMDILGMHSLIQDLAKLTLRTIVTDQCNQNNFIRDEKITFKLCNCSGILQFDWDPDTGRFKANKIQIEEVAAKVFQDLIVDWYGIELSCLATNDFISLKAEAEPQDPTLDRDDQGSSTLSQGKNEVSTVIETISKMQLSEPQKKSMIDYNKLSIELDKIDSWFYSTG